MADSNASLDWIEASAADNETKHKARRDHNGSRHITLVASHVFSIGQSLAYTPEYSNKCDFSKSARVVISMLIE